ETAPEALAGKSGELEIKLATTKNDEADTVFYENYMLQFTLMFEHEKCSNIIAADAVLASAGKSAAIAYTVLPKKDAAFSIKATVEDFEFDGIDITAMPFSMNFELPDTDDMVSDFRELTDAIAELNEGVGDLKSGVSTLKSGANELESGSLDIASGLRELGINSWTLLDSSAKIKNALWQVSSSLKSGLADMPDLSGLGELPAGLIELAAGLSQIADGLDALKGGFSQAYAALGSAIDDMPSASATEGDIQALGYAISVLENSGQLLNTFNALAGSYGAAQTVKGTYAHVKDAFEAVVPTLTQMSEGIREAAGNLNTIAGGISGSLSKLSMLSKLGELSSGLDELAANYGKFHDGLGQYFSGVGELSQGYGEFHSGIHEFAGGVGKLYSGARDLRKGTNELEDETSDMPEKVQKEIDDKLKEYTGSDFERVSFTSKQNTNIGVVQFVI
ncbi:MAG TPA: YhgE/Pip domain-containing protein, partial [Clostridia bacterium]|nr:YhgE/Pip domain-containing protein [Clostridia bacterium]